MLFIVAVVIAFFFFPISTKSYVECYCKVGFLTKLVYEHGLASFTSDAVVVDLTKTLRF